MARTVGSVKEGGGGIVYGRRTDPLTPELVSRQYSYTARGGEMGGGGTLARAARTVDTKRGGGGGGGVHANSI